MIFFVSKMLLVFKLFYMFLIMFFNSFVSLFPGFPRCFCCVCLFCRPRLRTGSFISHCSMMRRVQKGKGDRGLKVFCLWGWVGDGFFSLECNSVTSFVYNFCVSCFISQRLLIAEEVCVCCYYSFSWQSRACKGLLFYWWCAERVPVPGPGAKPRKKKWVFKSLVEPQREVVEHVI